MKDDIDVATDILQSQFCSLQLENLDEVIKSTRIDTQWSLIGKLKGLFAGRPADYLFLLLFNWVTLVVSGLMLNVWLLMDPMILSVLYIWCQFNKDTIVNFWFGTQFKAMYLPWILFAFNFIMAGGGFNHILGILVGHLYYFLMYTYPLNYGGSSLLQTPQILYDYFPSRRTAPGVGVPPASRQAPPNNGRGWGQGHALGD